MEFDSPDNLRTKHTKKGPGKRKRIEILRKLDIKKGFLKPGPEE